MGPGEQEQGGCLKRLAFLPDAFNALKVTRFGCGEKGRGRGGRLYHNDYPGTDVERTVASNSDGVGSSEIWCLSVVRPWPHYPSRSVLYLNEVLTPFPFRKNKCSLPPTFILYKHAL